MWWAGPQHAVDTSPPGPRPPAAAAVAGPAAVQTHIHVSTTNAEGDESANQGQQYTTTTVRKGGDGGAHALLECPVFMLDVLDPVSGGMRPVYSGPETWTDLGRSSSPNDVPIAPANAYFVRLSARISSGQPESAVGGVVLTAPRAPILELMGGGVAEGTGAATLRAFWTTDVNTSFLPTGDSLPQFFTTLEMAQAWGAGPTERGVGGTATQAFRGTAPGRRYAHSPRDIEAGESGKTRNGSSLASNGKPPSEAGDAADADVKVDAGGGLCWTLGSSSWDKPGSGSPAGRFRVVWKGFDGEAEAFTPSLPPGMRFAFRVRIECCYGVALSPVTIYQTATVVPSPPKVRIGTLSFQKERGTKRVGGRNRYRHVK